MTRRMHTGSRSRLLTGMSESQPPHSISAGGTMSSCGAHCNTIRACANGAAQNMRAVTKSSDAIDLTGIQLRWFDRWLKDVDNSVEEEPPIMIFVMCSDT